MLLKPAIIFTKDHLVTICPKRHAIAAGIGSLIWMVRAATGEPWDEVGEWRGVDDVELIEFSVN